jgi:hypothetical protein
LTPEKRIVRTHKRCVLSLALRLPAATSFTRKLASKFSTGCMKYILDWCKNDDTGIFMWVG